MFDYVMTLAAVIIGLALTHLMQGVAGMIEDRGKDRVWWVHLVWVAYMLLTTVFWWWFEYMLRGVHEWTFAVYMFVLAYAFVTYMTAAVLFPRQLKGYRSYEDYFLSRRRWFFALIVIATLIDPIDSALKGRAHLASLGIEYWIAIAVTVLICAAGMIDRRRTVQGAIAVVMFVYQVSWVARMFDTMH